MNLYPRQDPGGGPYYKIAQLFFEYNDVGVTREGQDKTTDLEDVSGRDINSVSIRMCTK